MGPNLVPGRECGACNECCVALTIDDPGLRKLQGFRCPNAQRDNSCKIYESRPQTCRSFFCGWRQLRWIKQPLRPDLSGVLVRLQYEAAQADRGSRFGVVFTLLRRAALEADGLAESVAAAVAAGVPTYLGVPGPPGHTSGQAMLNDVLMGAVRTRNKAEVLDILRAAWDAGRTGGEFVPIVLKPRGGRDP